MKPDIKVYRVDNGWLLQRRGDRPLVVEANGQWSDPTGILGDIAEALGLWGDRFDARRLVITTQPGNKHHDYHPDPCSECDCACDPDRSTPDDRDLNLLDDEVFDES